MSISLKRASLFALAIAVAAPFCQAQASEQPLPDAPQPSQRKIILGMPMEILKDQAGIWTSPARIRSRDLLWLTPLAAATAVAIATDHHTMSSVVSHDTNFNQTSVDASNALTGTLVAIPAVLYGGGLLRNNPHQRETGILTGEALADGFIVQEGMKLIFWRERPALDNSRGLFFQRSAGVDSSFPSNHSVLAWSSAAVIASEYKSPWVQAGVYTMATGVSLTRVMGQQHFPTDVLIGSATGWLIGRYVVRRHHGKAY